MAQRLETVIAINAQAGSGFSKVGNTLTEMGSMVDQLSQKIIEFGVDSAGVYKEYEKSMAETKVALRTAYEGDAAGLVSAMEQLDEAATNWAANSIFHTNDVASSITEAARAGWDLDKILNGIPAAMQLAQAGGIDLSEAVDYIVKATNGAGIEFDDLTGFIDQWAYSANSSATTIEEMGDAMTAMGRTMSFTSSTEELFAMMAALANVGYTGSQAGTVLRNAMIRLVAPTDKASAAMAALEVTQEELSELSDDTDYAAAAELISEMGLSVYDSEGNLRSMVDIFADLNTALSTMTEQDANSIMAAIFPTRTLAAGLALMEGAKDGYDGLYQSLLGGAAEGYGEYSAATMMDTLYGDVEIFYSKVENLKKTVGESLSDDIRSIAGDLGSFIDSIANMDEDKMDALVGALEVVAAAGPTMLVAGTALRLLGSKAALAGVSITGIVAGLKYIMEMDESRFENLFGDQELDSEALSSYIEELGSAYEIAYSNVDSFNASLNNSVESYKKASQEFSSDLLTAMLTKATLTDEEIEKLNNLGEIMQKSVLDGIGYSGDSAAAFWEAFFGYEHGEISDDPIYGEIVSTTSAWYENLYAEAELIGEGLKEAMTAAFADGQLSPEERENIMSFVADYNNTIAQAQKKWQDTQTQIELEEMLWKTQNASWDSILATSEEVSAKREEQETELYNNYMRERATYKVQKQAEIDEVYAQGDDRRARVLEYQMNNTLAGMDARYQQNFDAIGQTFAEFDYNLYDSALKASSVSDGYDYLVELGKEVLSGNISTVDARKQFTNTDYYNGAVGEYFGGASDVLKSLTFAITALGGIEDAINLYTSYQESGNTEMADKLGSLIMAYGIAGNYQGWEMYDSNPIYAFMSGSSYDVGNTGSPTRTADLFNSITPDLTLDTSTYSEGLALHGTLDTTEIDETISAIDEKNVDIGVDGDTSAIDSDIAAEDAKSITVDVYADTTNLDNTLAAYSGGFALHKTYAEGGRATSASIFGEDGAEWAIPEEHSQRTADLLSSAASASGFTWPELLGLNGGLNGGSSNGNTTIVYSPTIHANNAEGIAAALKKDKQALLKLLAEQSMLKNMEAYS